ncbi:MAG TPA: serine hydrolase [Puia sp.]|jgi:CubicO group peptidase (beta-lactamase class C family)|nr:serine hydrolase [Puia sp.]
MPASRWRPAILLLICFAIRLALPAQDLPRGIPEKEGVPATAISDFLNAASHGRTEFHSFMLLRHGKVIAEGWWDPYGPRFKHMLYSCSKTFTATAVGLAIKEKKLKLTDKVISFFPDDLPSPVPPLLAELTVKDALMMADGQDPEPRNVSVDTNWARAFLAVPIVDKPGTKFLYNSMGTYMLSAIVQKVTGQKVLDYLRPRLFDPLGITDEDWETSPQGVNTGGWGLRLQTEDMAKFGQLLLQKGKWNGRQLIPREWVEEATTPKILQNPGASQSARDTSDWLQGYCYQMWRCRHNGVRADGALGQFIILLPDQDAVIALTAETPSMQEEINLVWQYLLPPMQNWAYKEDPESDAKLKQQLAALAHKPLIAAASAADVSINGKTYSLQPNDTKINAVGFALRDGLWQVTIKGETGAWTLPFGDGRWARANTTRPGPSLTSRAKNSDVGLPAFETAGSYHWKDENTLELVLRYIESPHTERMVCHFDGDKISIEHSNSFDYGKGTAVLTGTAQ